MSAITFDQAATLVLATGFPASAAPTMVAIMAAESSLDPLATCDGLSIYVGTSGYALAQQYSCDPANAHVGPSCGTPPYTSFGLGQVNLPSHYPLLEQMSGSTSPCAWAQWLYVPAHNVAACYAIWQGSGFGAWTTYRTGAYRQNMPQAKAAVSDVLALASSPPPTAQPPSTGNGSTTAQSVPTPPSLLFLFIGLLGILGLAVVGGAELER